MATYLSAKNSGFTGSYTDWTKAGRPSGGTSSVVSEQDYLKTVAANTPTTKEINESTVVL